MGLFRYVSPYYYIDADIRPTNPQMVMDNIVPDL